MHPAAAGMRRIAAVLVDPAATTRAVVRAPALVPTAAALVVTLVSLGVATLPYQLPALAQALAPAGDQLLDAHHAHLWHGLIRFLVADRVVPSPSLLVAAMLIILAAEPVLALARDRRQALWAIVLVGLAPLAVQRLGQLAVTYAPLGEGAGSPGVVLQRPHRFVTGPLLFLGGAEPPSWAYVLEARVNLIALWCLTLWSIGLRSLDRRGLQAWHVGLPLAALAIGGFVSWALTQPVLAVVLGGP